MTKFNSEECWKEIMSHPGYTRRINPLKHKNTQGQNMSDLRNQLPQLERIELPEKKEI